VIPGPAGARQFNIRFNDHQPRIRCPPGAASSRRMQRRRHTDSRADVWEPPTPTCSDQTGAFTDLAAPAIEEVNGQPDGTKHLSAPRMRVLSRAIGPHESSFGMSARPCKQIDRDAHGLRPRKLTKIYRGVLSAISQTAQDSVLTASLTNRQARAARGRTSQVIYWRVGRSTRREHDVAHTGDAGRCW